MKGPRRLLLALMLPGCVEGGNLEISVGAPVSAAVKGRITFCGKPVTGAEVKLRVQQSRPEQAREVDVEVGPVATDRSGSYFLELAPAFAVPGPARVDLQVTASGIIDVTESELELRMGLPPRDTTRMSADLAAESDSC